MKHALFGACLALPLLATGTAFAAAPAPRTIAVPPGAVVLILPSADSSVATPAFNTSPGAQFADPMLRLIAAQDAMMDQMMAHMQAAFAQPVFPDMNGMIRAALAGTPTPGPGTGMVFTSVSAGPGVCTERMVYSYPAAGGAPRVTVTRSGDACAAPGGNAPTEAVQPIAPAPVAKPAQGPRLWTVSDPPHPIETGTPRS